MEYPDISHIMAAAPIGIVFVTESPNASQVSYYSNLIVSLLVSGRPSCRHSCEAVLYAKVMIKQWLHDQPLGGICHPAPVPYLTKTAESSLVRRWRPFRGDGVCTNLVRNMDNVRILVMPFADTATTKLMYAVETCIRARVVMIA
jgi:hypothetical protein